jgi:hypothetical protein
MNLFGGRIPQKPRDWLDQPRVRSRRHWRILRAVLRPTAPNRDDPEALSGSVQWRALRL